jgi:tRNA A37 threonylcarbamoyladenosine dehydratase
MMSRVAVKDTTIKEFIDLKQNYAKSAFDDAQSAIDNIDSKIETYDGKQLRKQYDKNMSDLEKLDTTFKQTNSRVKQTKDGLLKDVTDHINYIIDKTGDLHDKVEIVQKKLNNKKVKKSLASLAANALEDAGVEAEDLPETAQEPFIRHNTTGGKRKRRSYRKTRKLRTKQSKR